MGKKKDDKYIKYEIKTLKLEIQALKHCVREIEKYLVAYPGDHEFQLRQQLESTKRTISSVENRIEELKKDLKGK